MNGTQQHDQMADAITSEENELPEIPSKPRLRAATAVLAFVLYFIGQFIPAFVLMVVKTVHFVLAGGDIKSKTAVAELVAAAMPQIAIAGMIGGALGLALGAYLLTKSLRDNSSFGAAWVKGQPKVMPISFLWGGCAALIYMLIPLLLLPPKGESVGVFTQMAGHPGLGQITWVVIALLLAPFIEELLFRGIILGGLNRSFGVWWGAALTNILFIGVHFTEAIHYWPSFIGIGLLAVLTTRQRLITQSIGSAIAAHIGYNLVIVIFALLSA